GLRAITYTVQATDPVSGCAKAKSVLISNEPVIVPQPDVVILSHRTNCISPDGAMEASVHGNAVDYILQWYDGNSVQNKTDNVGEFYYDVDAGPYTTTAKDIVSGCVSQPVVTQIQPVLEVPEFDIRTVPTNCDVDIGEALYLPLNTVEIFDIE